MTAVIIGEPVHRLCGLGKRAEAQLTVDEGVENELSVLLDQIVDVSENSAIMRPSVSYHPAVCRGDTLYRGLSSIDTEGHSYEAWGRSGDDTGGDDGTYHMLTQLAGENEGDGNE